MSCGVCGVCGRYLGLDVAGELGHGSAVDQGAVGQPEHVVEQPEHVVLSGVVVVVDGADAAGLAGAVAEGERCGGNVGFPSRTSH